MRLIKAGIAKSPTGLFALISLSSFVLLAYLALSSRTVYVAESPTCVCKFDSSPEDSSAAVGRDGSEIGGPPKNEKYAGIDYVPSRQHRQPVKVIYKDLSGCEKPRYLDDYTARCWGKCNDGEKCQSPVTNNDILEGRAKLRCFEDFHLIGVRKCGSTDLSHWFLKTEDLLNKFGQRGHRSGVSNLDVYYQFVGVVFF